MSIAILKKPPFVVKKHPLRGVLPDFKRTLFWVKKGSRWFCGVSRKYQDGWQFEAGRKIKWTNNLSHLRRPLKFVQLAAS
jgi:hypothetical protein